MYQQYFLKVVEKIKYFKWKINHAENLHLKNSLLLVSLSLFFWRLNNDSLRMALDVNVFHICWLLVLLSVFKTLTLGAYWIPVENLRSNSTDTGKMPFIKPEEIPYLATICTVNLNRPQLSRSTVRASLIPFHPFG